MANGIQTVEQRPRRIEVPLTRVVTGVAIGLVEIGAEFADERLGRPANKITSIQVITPLVGVAAGIALSLMKNKSMRIVGNDLSVGFGAIAVLKLGNILRSTIQTRKIKNAREISLRRGSGQSIANRSSSMGVGNRTMLAQI